MSSRNNNIIYPQDNPHMMAGSEGIDDQITQMLKECPMLLDKSFTEEYPGIVGVAGFLDSVSKTAYRHTGKYAPFEKVGARNLNEFLGQVQSGIPEAVHTYQTVRDTLGLQ